MKNLRALQEPMKIYPKLRLGIKLEKGGVKLTGPHKVKFLEEPVTVQGKDDKGQPRKELKFIVEENSIKYRWQIPLLGENGQAHYLLEKLMGVEVGDERILEMKKRGVRNYTDVIMVDEAPEEPEDEEIVHPEDAYDPGREEN